MIKTYTISKITGLHLPIELRTMFVRRYNQIFKQCGDAKKAKNGALSFLKTRYNKIRGKWVKK